MRRILGWTVLLTAMPLVIAVCDSGSEPATVTLPVVADGSGLTAFTNAEGYEIELDEFRVVVTNLEFTILGETHTGLLERARRLLLPTARAHPGHYAGGEVTGELPGRFVVDASSGGEQALGEGFLLEGDYHGMNLTFSAGTAADGLAADDPLLGHVAVLGGTARRGAETWEFDAVLDVDEGMPMVGAPFTLAVRADTTATLVFRVLMVDPSTEGDTMLDGVDFAALDTDGDGQVRIVPGEATHNVVRRTLQVHDHWWLDVR